jgi:hypothetical protein
MNLHQAFSQEMWGAANSNYAGQMGLELNPASIVGAPYKWELHLLSLDASLTNNYMYLAGKSRLVRSAVDGATVDQDRYRDRYTKTPDKSAYASAFLKYPAFIWSDKKFALAFHVSTRVELSATGIPYHLAKFIKEGFVYTPQQKIDYSGQNTDAVLLNWHEIALTGGAVIQDVPESYISAAATLKYNYGLNAFFLKIDNMNYQAPSDSTLIIYDLNAEYGHATPLASDNGADSFLKQKGKGASVDIGVQYYRNRNDDFYNPCSRNKGDKPYDYKIGISIIDLGYIKYSKQARTYKFSDENTVWNGFDTVKFNGVGLTDTIFGNQFYNNPNGARDKYTFRLYTPAALSIQADVPLTSRIFLNGSIIQRIPFSRYEVKRSNEISVTARYESKNFEFAIPLSYYDFFKPRLGVAMRIKYLTFGTDMLGPLVGITDTYGVNFYFGISIKHFGTCNGRSGAKLKRVRIENCNTPGS